jgi:hypothetical protein
MAANWATGPFAAFRQRVAKSVYRQGRLAAVVVLDVPFAMLLPGPREVEVEVEIAVDEDAHGNVHRTRCL